MKKRLVNDKHAIYFSSQAGIFLYDISLNFYYIALTIAALIIPKAKLWVDGRKGQWAKMEALNSDKTPVIWMHCASLGEFEQGRPILEELKKKYPEKRILLTFFSPSGYEIRKNYPLADYVYYLPLDTAQNAIRFLNSFPIELAIFVKYDIWYHYLKELQKRDIPTLLISAIFRPNQFYFKPYGSFIKTILKKLTHIFLQNEATQQLLKAQGFNNYSLAGDTRLDRVLEIGRQTPSYPILEAFCQDAEILIAGSTWPEDEHILIPYIKHNSTQNQRFILAPHQLKKESIQQLKQELGAICYSEAHEENVLNYTTLIIDNIGMLAYLYRFAHVAYVGGGFKTGLHNTMEPAAYGCPIIFGPKYQKFEEALQLVKTGGGFSIRNAKEFKQILLELQNKDKHQKAAQAASQYVLSNAGATRKIINFITKMETG